MVYEDKNGRKPGVCAPGEGLSYISKAYGSRNLVILIFVQWFSTREGVRRDLRLRKLLTSHTKLSNGY